MFIQIIWQEISLHSAIPTLTTRISTRTDLPSPSSSTLIVPTPAQTMPPRPTAISAGTPCTTPRPMRQTTGRRLTSPFPPSHTTTSARTSVSTSVSSTISERATQTSSTTRTTGTGQGSNNLREVNSYGPLVIMGKSCKKIFTL